MAPIALPAARGSTNASDVVVPALHESLQRRASEGRTFPGLERRWIVYYAVGELLRAIYQVREKDRDGDIRKLYKPNDWIDYEKNRTKEAIAEIFKLATTAINKVYNQASKISDFRHRNWFRNDNTLSDLKAEIGSILEYRSARSSTSIFFRCTPHA